MESYSSYFQSQSGFGNSRSFDAFKNLHEISPVVQSHLKQVYLTLCCALVASAAGSYLHILWNIGGLLTTIACIGCMGWLLSIPAYNEQKRVLLLMGAAALEGASIGPLVDLAIQIDSSILVTAFVGCAIAFGCFSAAALLARRREFLYLGALLSSGVSILFWLHFASSIFGGNASIFKFEEIIYPILPREFLYLGALLSSGVSILFWLYFASSIFGGNASIFKFELYLGLLVFVGYIVFDTQEIIEKAHFGDMDYVKHALTLFTDFIAVFVRILIIMLKNSVEKNDKKKRRD